MKTILSDLTAHQREYVNDQLCNNDVSDDAEIVALWIEHAGMTAEQANAAISFRDQALMDPFFQLFPTP